MKRREELKNLGFKNLLAEICHFNTPKYKNQFSQEKSTGSYNYVGLDYIFINTLTKSLVLIWEIYITVLQI